MSSVVIEILNWSKYNPRSQIKAPRWFALNNRILENSSLFDLNAEEFKAWIYLLCQASQQNSSVVAIDFRHAERISLIKRKTFTTLFPKLIKAQCIQLRDHGEITNDPAVITTLQDKTLQDTTVGENNSNKVEFQNSEELAHSLPKKLRTSWARRFDADWLFSEVEKCFEYYTLVKPEKKPKTQRGWTTAVSGWIGRSKTPVLAGENDPYAKSQISGVAR